MQVTKEKIKEISVLNLVLMVLAAGSIMLAGYVLVTGRFKGGTDDLFLVLVCLLAALLFAIVPFMWAYEQGYVAQFLDVGDESPPAHAEEAHEHGITNKQNLTVWGALLALTGVEVFLAYIHLDLTLMLIIVMGLSIIKAALIMAYFMHLKFERMSFVLTIVPALVVLLCLFAIFFPDSFRLNELR
ncbi:MAG TPA: cytochrome C oxidase subunit IV family protein [Blastocatellia bacterium]|nr:cytochrome C oxidase subunit IV family protein [Blastocatellia bacterium]